MATNNRVYYAIQQVGIAAGSRGNNNFTPVHGVQSVGITTTFNLEQVFELGQISIYENVEGTPDVEVTMSKVLDGYIPLYCFSYGLGRNFLEHYSVSYGCAQIAGGGIQPISMKLKSF